MVLTPAQIDKISEELRSHIRGEVKSKKIRKLEPRFYDNLNSALMTLKEEADRLLKAGDITNYIKIKDRADEIERDFRSLFQRRFEKIASLSIYDLDSELMSSLTPEEKEFITKLHNIMLDEYNLLLRKVPESPVRSSEVKSALEKTPEPEQKTVVTAKNDSQSEPVGVPQTTKEYLLVRILGDQPPIAQPDGDYFLHDQDVIYLDKKFAELLIKRNAAKKIEIK